RPTRRSCRGPGSRGGSGCRAGSGISARSDRDTADRGAPRPLDRTRDERSPREERAMSSNGKVAIVTGAGDGIGKGTPVTLLKHGCSVALAGRRADALAQAIKEAGNAGTRALAVPTDVADASSIRALFGRTKDQFGRLDLLFNNAGNNAPGIPLEDLTLEQW